MAEQRSMYGKDALYVTDRNSPNATKVVDVQKWRTNQDDIRHLPGALPMQRLSIQDGAISPSSAFVLVDTEGGAPSDDLVTINLGDLHNGMEIELVSIDSSRTVTVKNSTSASGIRTMQNQDIVLDTEWPIRIKMVSTESITYWKEIPRTGKIKISDSVNLADSTTVASAKAVKTANDAALTAHALAQDAKDSAVLLTGNQTVAGAKTFTTPITANLNGSATRWSVLTYTAREVDSANYLLGTDDGKSVNAVRSARISVYSAQTLSNTFIGQSTYPTPITLPPIGSWRLSVSIKNPTSQDVSFATLDVPGGYTYVPPAGYSGYLMGVRYA